MTPEVQGAFDFGGHQENLERVSARIGRAVIAFFREHSDEHNKRFHADELRACVIRLTGIAAPASADRVMRDMRQRGLIGYKLISRRESLYEVIRIGEGHVEDSGAANKPPGRDESQAAGGAGKSRTA